MTNPVPFSVSLRGVRAALAAAWVAGLGVVFVPAGAAVPAATVARVASTRIADLVMLDGGFDAGLRQGMMCRVTRGSSFIADVQLVDLRASSAAALIMSLEHGQAIRPGDAVIAKIFKT